MSGHEDSGPLPANTGRMGAQLPAPATGGAVRGAPGSLPRLGHGRLSRQLTRESERAIVAYLAAPGGREVAVQRALRDAAQRFGIGVATVHRVMHEYGYRAVRMTVWVKEDDDGS